MTGAEQIDGIVHRTVLLQGSPFHVAETGDGELAVLLHGFPECWYSWRHVMAALAPHFRVVAPDGRGFHGSDRSAALAAYTPAALCADLLALLDHYGARQCVLVGHDWGGLLAWFFAGQHPERVSRLVVLNAPHPNRFQWALDHDAAQRAASSYITRLRAPGCAGRLLGADAQVLWDMTFGALEQRGMLGPADKAVYLAGWRQSGAVDAMLNWYRAAPFVVPADGEPLTVDHQHLIGTVAIAAPTLLVWGMQDDILLPLLLDGLDALVPRLTIARIADGGHGVMHEQPARVAALIRDYLLERTP